MPKRNPPPSFLFIAVGAAVVGFLLLRSKKTFTSPRFLLAARWEGDRLIDPKACFDTKTNTWVAKTECGRK